MKNFGTLFRYELKKIWKQPLLWVVVFLTAAFLSCIMGLDFLPTKHGNTFTTTDAEGKEISRFLTADEQFRIKLEGGKDLAGQVMDEEFFRKAREAIPAEEDRYEAEAWFLLVDPSYYQFWYYNSIELGGTAEEYYANRQSYVNLEMQHLRETERAYWETMEEHVEKPFRYHPENGMQVLYSLISSSGIVFFVPLLAGACLCELFARERRTKMDALVFSSRRGRKILCLAKIIAGGLSAVLAAALVSGITVAVYLVLYGPESWYGAIQLLSGAGLSWCSWPITMGQGILILLALTLVFTLLCGGLVAAVSVFTGNGIAAMATAVAMMLLSQRHVQGLLGRYLPARLINPDTFRIMDLTELGGLQLNIFQSGALLYAVIAVVLLALCWFGWRRWATTGR